MLNKVFLEGRVVRTPELKESKTGVKYSFNTLAVNVTKDKVVFIPVTLFDSKAELLCNYCGKGDLISVEGSISVKVKEDKSTELSINVMNIHFLAKKQDSPKEVK